MLLTVTFLEAGAPKINPAALPLVLTEGCPSAFVENVNVIAGIYYEKEVDLVIPGSEPLVFEHKYAGVFPTGWNDNLDGVSRKYFEPKVKSTKTCCFEFCPPGGSRIICSGPAREKAEMTLKLNHQLHGKGLTNCAYPDISGQNDLKNVVLYIGHGSHHLKAFLGNGEQQLFVKTVHDYIMKRRDLPSGFSLNYDYCADGVKCVTQKAPFKTAQDPSDSSISVAHYKSQRHMKGSNGKSAIYHLVDFARGKAKKETHYIYISKIERATGPDYTYQYMRQFPKSDSGLSVVCNKVWPSGKFFNLGYYHAVPKDSPQFFRVELIQVPTDQGPQVSHRFLYHCNPDESGMTEVHSTRKMFYFYNKDHYLTSIETLDQNGALYTKEKFFWTPDGKLQSKYLYTKKGPIAGTSYVYDAHHNVSQVQYFGDLTGHGNETIIVGQTGLPEWGEWEGRYFEHSQDSFNLKTLESEGQTRHQYIYEPCSNRKSVHFTKIPQSGFV
jgi:hypothetical protein